jgi:hypothetical protein
MTLPAKAKCRLCLDLLCASERAVAGPHHGVLRPGAVVSSWHAPQGRGPRSPSGSSGLAQFLQLDQRMLHYLLENDTLDGRLNGYATLLPPATTVEQVLVDPTLKARLVNVCQRWFLSRHLDGAPSSCTSRDPMASVSRTWRWVCVRSGAAPLGRRYGTPPCP